MEKKELLLSGVNQRLIFKKVNTTQEFRELKDRWDLLLEQSSDPNIFLTWEWLFTWWEFYGEKYQLFILMALDQDENVLGIAPLCLTRFSPLKLKILRFLGTEEVCSDHLDFIFKKGMEKELFPLFLKYLEEHPREWDLLDLTDFRADFLSLPLIQTWAEKNKYEFSINLWTVCPYVSLPDTWELLLSNLSAKARKDIKYQLKSAKDHGEVSHSTVEDKNEVSSKMEILFYLHGKRWSSLGEHGVFQRENFNRFHKKIAELFFDRGWLLLFYLSAEDKIIALYYNFVYSNKIYYYQSGFDPDWKDFSPGTAAIALTIKSAISQGIKEFDFLREEAPYKYKWTDKNRKNMQILVWNRNLKSSLCRNGLVYTDKAKKLTKKYMPDYGVKILKSLWRRLKITGE